MTADQSPPHSIEAEQSLLGGLMLDNSAWDQIADVVDEGDFYRRDHRLIFRAIRELANHSNPYDVVTLSDWLKNLGELDQAGGLAYLGTLANNTPSAANIKSYAHIVREHAQRRQVAAIGAELHAKACAPGADSQALRLETESKLATIGAGVDLAADWPGALDLEVLAEREPQAPQSIMEGIPCGYATGIFGHGGAGKSSIALYLAVCIAAGIQFCGFEVARRRVKYISCEDRADILHWRLTRVCTHLGVDLASLRGWLEIVDLVGRDSILFAPDPRTGNALTAAYGILAERMRDCASEVLFLDGITDTFGANENSRSEVKHFINTLLALIAPDTGALILIGHVNKATASGATGEGYSGSTAWHNSMRARWYLSHETIQGEDTERTERTGKLIFELQKSNHGEVGAQIEFEWDADAHLFIGRAKGGATHFDRLQRDKAERQGILEALSACAASVPAIAVPAAMQGQRTAYHVLSLRPEFPASLRAGKPAVRRFRRQIEVLRQIHAIEETSYRRANGHKTVSFALTAEGARRYAE